MTTAAKRASKKANLRDKRKREEEAKAALTDVLREQEKVSPSESEHAASLTALAAVRKLKNRFRVEDASA